MFNFRKTDHLYPAKERQAAMIGETEQRFASFGETRRRSPRRGRRARAARWTGGLAAVVAAGLLAAAPAGAQAPPRDARVFVHSAKSGELSGGRLTLHGVRARATWTHNSGRFGVMAVKRMHRLLFPRAKLAATGTLHVAGHRGGDELIFKLSKPRYNQARRTVSYKAKRLNNKPLPSRVARAAGIASARKFSAASLTIVPAAQGGSNACLTGVINQTTLTLTLSDPGHSAWLAPPPGSIPSPNPGGTSWNAEFASDGTCSSSVAYELQLGSVPVKLTFKQTADKNDRSGFSYSCTSSVSSVKCTLNGADPLFGLVSWTLTVD